ncbi:M56 family metallopeptidase [Achromobacter seleniivolatilans]|uniref:M56 family metallopeptidase n=1 Tax=Achromobacter seleniivolatilans TaxID=3047478 RepID=A0ABY9LZL2_9BURK|nr:M56 family metallopeptidase [Achromobacter sp. R39]WMD20211.1 M56 family metallopeptidase [Achromobacter sp. R39]
MTDFLLSTAWTLGGSLPVVAWKILCLHAATLAVLSLTRPDDARLRYTLLGAALFAGVAIAVTDVALAWRGLPAAAASPPGTSATAWPLWLALAWLAGSAIAALRVLLGLGWLRGVLRASQPWNDPAWQARVADMARRLRLSRTVGLRVVRNLSSPVTAGWLKPVILVPASLVTGMPADLLAALLAHELAHVRRHDYLVNLLQHAAEVLLFFHPSIWWLSRHLRIERERIADQMAAALIGSPMPLARALHSLERAAADAPASVAPAARDGDLLDRIRRLVRPDTLDARRVVALPVLAMSCALAGFGAWTTLMAGPAQPLSVQEAQRLMARLPGVKAMIEASGASHVLVLDTRSGATLLGRAENDAVPIASLTKLMTAMVVLDAAPDLSRPVRIDERDARATASGAASQLPVGASVTLDTLLKLALMASDNRAAHALARTYPGGEPAFVQAVQRKTAALHLKHTTLEEPTGLSTANRASAADIGRIVSAAAAYPQIARDTTALVETVDTAGNRLRYHNTNPLVGAQGWDIRLSKTGTSTEAGRCLAMRIHIDDRDLTLVLLNGHPDRG